MVIISAIICTCNRAQYLQKAIESLGNQSLPKRQYEIIIVDNASTDQSKQIVADFQSLCSNITYVYEPIPGVSQARNAGLKSATAKYVSFLDDDAIASREWLSEIITAFENISPRPVCVGGRVLPIWEIEKPPWFPEQFIGSLSLLDKGDTPRFLRDNEIVVGTNMAYDKEVLNQVGGFNPDLLLYSDEVYVQDQIITRGWPRYYQPAASVEHLVPRGRLTKNYICKRKYLGAKGEFITSFARKGSFVQKSLFLLSNLTRRPLRMLYHWIRYMLIRDKTNSKEATLQKVQVYKNLGFWIQSLQKVFHFL